LCEERPSSMLQLRSTVPPTALSVGTAAVPVAEGTAPEGPGDPLGFEVGVVVGVCACPSARWRHQRRRVPAATGEAARTPAVSLRPHPQGP
jgi:hypothetical protein